MKSPLETPVVLILFNRPEHVRRVFNSIAEVMPKRLFLIGDGPRSPEEVALCQEARSVTDLVDWDCDLSTDFSDHNLGLPDRFTTGLNSVFERVDEAIILEDDCVPSQSFFQYCELLLNRFKGNDRIMEVGGCNLQFGRSRTSASYYFSKYIHTWGWATWRRAWQHFDPAISSWPEVRATGGFDDVFQDEKEKQYWTWMFDRLHAGRIDTWDFQWLYALWSRRALSVVPSVNLVTNIGFGQDSTHTRKERDPLANMIRRELDSIQHPHEIVVSDDADQFEFEHAYGGRAWSSPIRRVLRRLRHLIVRGNSM